MVSYILDEAIGMTEDIFFGVWIACSKRSSWDCYDLMLEKFGEFIKQMLVAFLVTVLGEYFIGHDNLVSAQHDITAINYQVCFLILYAETLADVRTVCYIILVLRNGENGGYPPTKNGDIRSLLCA